MAKSLVSIIVPCYKQAHLLDETLNSVMQQTYKNWECVIVNDGSPDHTEEVALEWCKKDKRFSYVSKKNGGLPAARNTGVKKTSGKFILPLDSDDILHEQYIEKLLPYFDDPTIGIVTSYRFFFVKSKTNIIKIYKPNGDNYRNLMFENQLMPSSIYKKECWVEVGGYDESMIKGFEDWEFWLNITKRGWLYHTVEEPLFYYRKAKESMLIDTHRNHAETNKKYIFWKHKELYIKHFDNFFEVMFYNLNVHRKAELQIKNSLEYKIGKALLIPFKVFKKLFKFVMNMTIKSNLKSI
ncbi:glycosyl transferase family 2 [Tamlana nanhaiensis]|uniref:Glycosyl transferase family 2 n=1 Tax=Neotamlana nanhaiensis TaxID=1382798 RepID=A0A0D7W2T1_9FLAO|nr:glycosyltransferase family A protein [Tamlana nanhaiensis]KJD33396.1 glycosyl transferase family 2 [Tamlana nanhaiensis]